MSRHVDEDVAERKDGPGQHGLHESSSANVVWSRLKSNVVPKVADRQRNEGGGDKGGRNRQEDQAVRGELLRCVPMRCKSVRPCDDAAAMAPSSGVRGTFRTTISPFWCFPISRLRRRVSRPKMSVRRRGDLENAYTTGRKSVEL